MQKYIAECDRAFSQYGFKRRGKKYLRVVNDVVQGFELERLHGYMARILYDVLPLCMPYDSMFLLEEHVCDFDDNGTVTHYGTTSAEFNRNSVESINNCIDELIEIITKYIIPVFLKADDSKRAFEDFLTRKYLIYEYLLSNQIRRLMSSNGTISLSVNAYDVLKVCNGFVGRLPTLPGMCFMACKNGYYEFAVLCYENLRKDYQGYFADTLGDDILILRSNNVSLINEKLNEYEEFSRKKLKNYVV